MSKRKAKEGKTGPCGTSTAVTLSRSSSMTVKGRIGGAVFPRAEAPTSGKRISCTSCLGTPTNGIEDLMDLPWILPGRNTQLRQEIDELFDRRGLPLPANIIECSTILTLKTVLVETDAVAPLPMLIGARDPLLDVLPLALDTVPREIGITTLADRPPSDSTRLLIKEIVAVARETDPVLWEPRG